MRLTFLLVFFIFYTSISSTWASSIEISTCHKEVNHLKSPREQVADYDGIWGLFQKNKELQGSSVEGISLDKEINSMIFHLEFLCETIDGIPFDELSDYISVNLAEKGEEKFRQELIVLGKNERQIEVWFKFAKFAVENRYRALDPQIIFNSIRSATPFIKNYLELAKKIDRKKDLHLVVEEVKSLTNEIQTFFLTDPYMSQSFRENAQIPYADWDENYGGS
jgi:hypothetical protein